MRFHRYAGAFEYSLAGWLIAHPFQQGRKFWLQTEPEMQQAATLAEILLPHCSNYPSGKTLSNVLQHLTVTGHPMQPSDIRYMPNFSGTDDHLNSRSRLAHAWMGHQIHAVAYPDCDPLRSLKLVLCDMRDALEVMDCIPERWPDVAFLGSAPVEFDDQDEGDEA